ncbi:MAG TPA: nucleotidyltransferase domain-containing protein [Candidatus Nanoarchaeia archaeon]|nr:nucleotidyltransferase domain-containing protein [Candidatus Nanoarchaeia archaeon]
MINKEYLILEPFTREPWKALTFKEVKKLSNNKSDNYVHTTLKTLVKEEILKEQKIGNNLVYSLCKNVFALNTIGFIVEFKANQAKHLPHRNIQKILDKIKTLFYSFVITGSYAKNKQKETSDVDIVIICDNKHPSNAILSQIKLESELMIPEFHPYVFTQAEFYEMLINKEANYGKEIAKNNLIVTGGKEYYTILLEAIEHGFDG